MKTIIVTGSNGLIGSESVKFFLDKRPDYITFQARERKRQNTYKYMIRQVLR
jgi:FlaA1/EpsC-like NDP-sugar epimerase